MELLERKKENQRLLDEEFARIKGKSMESPGGGKVTRAQIEETLLNEQQEQEELQPKGKDWVVKMGQDLIKSESSG